jgi:hypothetical protein
MRPPLHPRDIELERTLPRSRTEKRLPMTNWDQVRTSAAWSDAHMKPDNVICDCCLLGKCPGDWRIGDAETVDFLGRVAITTRLHIEAPPQAFTLRIHDRTEHREITRRPRFDSWFLHVKSYSTLRECLPASVTEISGQGSASTRLLRRRCEVAG